MEMFLTVGKFCILDKKGKSILKVMFAEKFNLDMHLQTTAPAFPDNVLVSTY